MAKETKEERRSFEGPDGKTKYFIANPSANDIREADWQYSRVYTRSLTEGITTSAEMMDILRRRGIIGPEFEQRASELTQNLNEKIWSLDAAESMDEKRTLAVDVAEARDELFQWNQRLNGPMANTCEQLADDARLEYLTSCMIVDKDDNRVWDDLESYLKEKNQALALKSRFEVMLYLQGLDSDFLEKTPEAEAMREVERDILAKAEEAAKALEAAAEEVEKATEIEEKEEKPKKKTTRKRTTTKKKTTSTRKKKTE
jgi:hypothetical protein